MENIAIVFADFKALAGRALAHGAGRKEKISSDVENLVLRARSEQTGYAVNICRGRMAIWNVGMLGLLVVHQLMRVIIFQQTREVSVQPGNLLSILNHRVTEDTESL